MPSHDHREPSRRGFLRNAGLLAAAGLTGCKEETTQTSQAPPPAPPAQQPAATPPAPETQSGELQRRVLGRTKLEVCVVGMGTTSVGGPQVVRRAVTEGINYIDTSMCYMGGRSEEMVGQGLKGIRDQAVIATKWDAGPDHTKDQIVGMLDASLKRLGTDYVDIILIHQLGDHGPFNNGEARLDNPHLYEAIAEVKKAGKARFAGASSHVGHRRKLLEKAIDTDAFDMILVSYNYSNFKGTGVPELLAKCQQKNIGVVGMKALQGDQAVVGLSGQQEQLYQANLRWTLAQGCHTVVNSKIGSSVQHQDLAMAMARSEIKVSRADQALLQEYAVAVAGEYCRGCGDICQGACPSEVRIADILRYRMYHRNYGDREQAVARYNALSEEQQIATLCGECNLCTQACPHDLQVVEQLFDARQLMLA